MTPIEFHPPKRRPSARKKRVDPRWFAKLRVIPRFKKLRDLRCPRTPQARSDQPRKSGTRNSAELGGATPPSARLFYSLVRLKLKSAGRVGIETLFSKHRTSLRDFRQDVVAKNRIRYCTAWNRGDRPKNNQSTATAETCWRPIRRLRAPSAFGCTTRSCTSSVDGLPQRCSARYASTIVGSGNCCRDETRSPMRIVRNFQYSGARRGTLPGGLSPPSPPAQRSDRLPPT